MTIDEAKRVLVLFRPGTTDANDSEFAEALELARNHLELGAWFENHCAFQAAMRDKFRRLEVPPGLKARLEETQRLARQQRWVRRTAWMAAAAAVLLLALAGALLGPRIPDSFADYRSRMVGTAQRTYPMDIHTDNKAEVRRHMNAHGAPSNYTLPPGIDRLTQTGGGVMKWRSNPVSMVCFVRGDKQMLFLFVMKKTAVKDSPPAVPQLERVNSLLTLSWTQGDNTYVLAGPEEPGFEEKYP